MLFVLAAVTFTAAVKISLGLTEMTVRVQPMLSPNSSSSCSLEKVFTIKLRMKRTGRKKPRAPHKRE